MYKNLSLLPHIIATSFLFIVASFTSIAQIPAGYYDAANGQTGEPLKNALHNIIKGHTEYTYSSSGTDVWDILKEADRDPNNSNNVIGIYSNFTMDAAAEYAGGAGWNREHVWAKSRGDFGTSRGAGTDVHHLRACDISTNSARNNRNFGEGTIQYVDGSGNYQGTTDSYTSSTEWVWEPRDEVKGDVARMVFYMATRYEGGGGEPDLELTENLLSNTDKSPFQARLSTLLEWHQNDPVSDAERNRNDIVYSYQNNRNPFIDHPEYVCTIYSCNGDNSTPVFTTTAITSATVNQTYAYAILTEDANNDVMTITATTLPSWLSFTDTEGGTASLTGVPTTADIGSNNVVLSVTDGATSNTQQFAINVSTADGGNPSNLFFSEYVEGSSYNKGLEIANFTGATVDLSSYSIQKQTNGAGDWGTPLQLSGTITNGDVFVVVNSSAHQDMQAVADLITGSTSITFNGNDPLGLFKNDDLLDAIGNFNGGTTDFAKDITLIRKSTVTNPNETYSESEWDIHGKDVFSDLGTHSVDLISCSIATGQSVSNITPTSASISWLQVPDATSYNIRFKPLEDIDWVEMEATENDLMIEDFNAGTNYEFQVQSVCSTISIAAYSSSTNFTTLEDVIAFLSSNKIEEFKVSVFPNPSLDLINIEINVGHPTDIYVEIGDFNGRIIYSKKSKIDTDKNDISLHVRSLKNGTYILRIVSNTNKYSQIIQIAD